MPKLQVFLPEGNEVTHDLAEEVVTIGRVPDNVIQIEDPSVSSRHAQISLLNGNYHLKDLDSTNGTRVNGKNFVEWQLEDGDKIRFGKVECVYMSEIASTRQPLPEADEPAIVVAETSQRPSDFANASPFKTKKKKRDPVGKAIIGFAVLAMLVFGAAVASILSLQPPQ